MRLIVQIKLLYTSLIVSASLLSISTSMSARTTNLLQRVPSLVNKFHVLRHGQSEANIAKIISSDPSISVVKHGLSDVGKIQVSKTASDFVQKYIENEKKNCVAIYSSDFKRARETSEIFASHLKENNIESCLDDI